MSDEQTPKDVPHYTAVADLIESEPSFVEAVKDYYAAKRSDYQQRIADIEDLLGFLHSEEDLSTRLSKLERFTGIKVG